jgi:hypothetical protein
MNKFIAVLQMSTAVFLGVIAMATAVNLFLISTRPETISVVNTLIGQGLIIICLVALANILLRKGIKSLRASRQAD